MQDLTQSRTDIYSHFSKFSAFKDLIQPHEQYWDSENTFLINELFDDYFRRFTMFLEGQPYFNLFYSHPIYFLLDQLKKNKRLFLVSGAF